MKAALKASNDRLFRAMLAFVALLTVMPLTARAMLVAGGGPMDGGTMICECWVAFGKMICVCLWIS